jgi:Domain of unknown function (DUF4357)
VTTPSTRRGFSVHVFLPDGDPDGVKVVEKDNWTGRGLVIPRSRFADTRHRDELNRTGVYLLTGPSDGAALPMLYVGEGDPVKARIDQHARSKDFWTQAVVFTSKDQNLNKAHVQHLESRLVELAAAAKRTVLDNSNAPKPPSLSEADVAAVEGFLDDLLLCLPLLGLGFFEPASALPVAGTRLLLRAKGIEAKGHETSSGFVVRQGSQAVGQGKLAPSMHRYLADLRDELVRQGVMVAAGDGFTFAQDYTFASPSTAAGVLLGRSSNGRVEWKDAQGRTLKELQDSVAADEEPE